MKEKILAAIKAKYPKVNLSKERKDAIAAIIEKRINGDEEQIDAAIDDFNTFNSFEDIAKTDDQIRNLKANQKPAPAKQDPAPAGDDPTKDIPDDMPEWAKKMYQSNMALQNQIAAITKKEAQTSISAKVEKLIGKDVPKSFYAKWTLPEKDEDIDAFVESIKTDWTEFQQELNNAGLEGAPPPGGGNAGGSAADTKVPDVVKAAAEKIKQQVAAAQKTTA